VMVTLMVCALAASAAIFILGADESKNRYCLRARGLERFFQG
jgi:hypothetical protein